MVYDSEEFLIQPSRYFQLFVEEEKVKLSFFEKMCKLSHKVLKIKSPEFIRKKLENPIYLSGMKANPDEVFSFFITSFLFSFLIFLPISLIDFPSTVIFLFFPFFIAYNVISYPQFYSDVVKIRAGNETVSIILYMVTYLSLIPVYEKAIQFAASHCHGPLGNDLKKVVWDVHSGRFTNIKEALSVYSRKWYLWNEEFVNSLVLLQSLEFQPSNEQRNETMRTAVDRIINSTYNKMEEYAASLKMPSTLLMMFGIMLPLMGLVMFPLVSIFLTNTVNPLYVGMGYTVFLPFFLWWFLYRMMSKRPATYSHSDRLEEVSPESYITIEKLKIKIPIVPLAILIGFIIAIPGILYYLELYSHYSFIFSTFPENQAMIKWEEYSLSRYEPAVMINDTFRAIFLIWGLGIAIALLTYLRSKKAYNFDLFVRRLEKDFEGGLFELQSALHQNIPIETAIAKVIEQYKRLKKTQNPIFLFFSELYNRMIEFAATMEEILFGEDGLLVNLPSSLIKNVMGIVTSSLSKGPVVASNVTKNVVIYLGKIREIEHMIKDAMREVVSTLTMQGKFIAPFIAGIVASASVVVIQFLQSIAKAIKSIEQMYNFGTNIGGSMTDTISLLNLKKVMPPTIMELIAGIYLIESVIIIAIFITGITRGFSKVYRDYYISRFVAISVILFTIVFFVMVFMFQPILSSVGG